MISLVKSNRVRGRATFLLIGFVGLVVLPAVMSEFRLSLLAKYLCFAIVAVGIDLAWGYGGMLTLGQGLFFGLGGYAMGMFLKLQEAGSDGLPDFMCYNGLTQVPAFWRPFRHAWFALPAALLIPMAVAAGLGALVFRQRIRGAYFAILTQALAAAFVILLIGQQGYTAGTNGLTNMKTMFGYDLNDPVNQRNVYLAVAVSLGIVYLIARQLVHSRYGRLLIAVRDGEDRVRFLGYNPTVVKVLAFTVSAGMAGLAGALFVPVVGIMSPAALVGRNGVGKTTLLNTVMGVLKPSRGRETWEGRDITGMRPHERIKAAIGYAPQGHPTFPQLTVAENLAVVLESSGASGAAGKAAVDEALDLFPRLKALLTRKAGFLSGGQAQQLALARTLVTRPRRVVLDEPTEGIQPSIILEIEDAIAELHASRGMSILLVEQYVEFALRLADRYAVLDAGEVVASGEASDLADDSSVRRLLAV